jgi:RND family efflux transporter MFP subunit
VENAVGYIKKNFLAGADLPDFTALGPAVKLWQDTIANVRIHGETHKKPLDMFAEEQPHLLPVPQNMYDIASVALVRASSQFRIALDANRYSVPARFAGVRLTMKVYPDRLTFYHNNKLIARHARSFDRNRDFEDPDHPKELIAQRKKAHDQHICRRFLALSPRALDYYRELDKRHLNVMQHVRTIVALSEIHGDDAVIRAPFAGVVISKNAQPGEMISPISAGGGYTRTGICTIVDMSSLETEVDVNESYINRVEAGQPVIAALDSYPDWKIPCKVIAIIPAADRQKATVKVRIGFDKLDPRILPDMGVKVAFQRTGDAGGQASALTVAKNAIWREGSQAYAFVVKNGRLEKRAVKTGEVKNEDCAVLEGLFAGETIVIEGQQKLKDGMVVQEKKR